MTNRPNHPIRSRARLALIPSILALTAHAAIAAPPAPPAPPAPVAPVAPAAPSTPGRWETATPPAGATPTGVCRELITENPTLDAALRDLTFEGAEGRRPLKSIKIVGLKTLDEKLVWHALGGQPPEIDAARAAVVLRQLAALGLFASLTPVIDMRGEAGPTLTITVVENPTVRKVVIEGLGEQKPEELLRLLLEAPSRKEVERRDRKDWEKLIDRAAAEIEREKREQEGEGEGEGEDDEDDDDSHKEKKSVRACLDPLPARDWVARAEDQVVFPGIVWKGLPRGLSRVIGRLYDKGYQMATLTAELGADGTLTVRVDEGRVTKIDVVGVAPQIEDRVKAVVGIETNKPFVKSDLDGTVKRIRAQFPFLRSHSEKRSTRARPKVVEKTATAATLRWGTQEEPAATESRWFTVQDGKVVLYLKAKLYRGDVTHEELIRHTPVTSFAPGLEAFGLIWDPADRAHGRIDLGGNVNTTRAAAGPSDSWRFDVAGAGSVQVPVLRLAELGMMGYARVDTADRWRIDRIDSYFNSIFFNRADTDYFRRTGLTAFATFHLFERLTAGFEYRRDSYRSLMSVNDMFTLFNRSEAPPATAPIDEGKMGSMLLRLEWSSARAPLGQFGGLRRDPERSIVNRPEDRAAWAEVRTMNTLEIADPSLGGDFKFMRLVSDSAIFLRTGHDQGLKLRFRAAGRLGDSQLPLQKQESLGGWTGLRGYGFKEFRGSQFSLLGTAEYRMEEISAFVDVGSVRTAGSFAAAKTGAGIALNFSDEAHLDFAWRTDDGARWRPEIRLLFHRAY